VFKNIILSSLKLEPNAAWLTKIKGTHFMKHFLGSISFAKAKIEPVQQ
jgi:hypothetical protein